MQENVRNTKIYNLEWEDRLFFLSLNFNDDGLMINGYRPPDLEDILGVEPFISKIREEEFLCVWTKYIIGLSICSEEKDIIERNIGALTFAVMESSINNQSITFYNLLDYMDCFSLMLREQGISEEKIKYLYLPVTNAIILNFKNYVIDPETGNAFVSTSKYQKLLSWMRKKY